MTIREDRKTRRLQKRIADLESRLAESEETLRAIRNGEVDAVVVSGAKGEQVFSLFGAESVYRLIVETMKESAFTVAFDGTILYCNEQFSQFLGRPTEQIIGRRLKEFVAENDREAATTLLEAAREQPARGRLVFRTADGNAAPSHIAASLLNQPDELSICIVASDLTELENSTELIQQLRTQQEALTQSEARFKAVFQASADAIMIADDEGRFIDVNPAAERLFGVPAVELIGSEFARRVDPGTDLKAMWDIFRTQGCFHGVLEALRPDGSIMYLDTVAIARIQPGRHLAVSRDVTERRRSEEERKQLLRELDEQRARLQAIIDSLPVPLWIADDKGRMTFVNESAHRLWGGRAPMADTIEDYGSYKASDPLSKRRLAAEDMPMVRSLAGAVLKNVELEIERLDGSMATELVSSAPIRLSDGAIVGSVAVIQDITERRKAEEQLRKGREELEEKVRERTRELSGTNRTLRMISECNRTLIRVADEKELMRRICRIIVEIGGYRMAWVGYAEAASAGKTDKVVKPVAATGFEDGFLDVVRISWADDAPPEEPTGSCIRTGNTSLCRYILEAQISDEWRREAEKRGFYSAIALPLISGRNPFGALTIYSALPDSFEDADLLRELADNLAFGIMTLRARGERDQARRTAVRRAEQLQALATELVKTEQKERKRLAQILHDHLQQILVGAKFGVSLIRSKAKDRELQQNADELARTIDEAISASRSLSTDLSPPILHQKGLAPGLEWLLRQMEQKHGLKVKIESDPAAEPKAEQIRLFLFEAVRELLLNVVKHARVLDVQVSLHARDGKETEVTIEDQGIGFDPTQIENSTAATGLGLFSIRERLTHLGGHMKIEAAPGRGSRFTLVAPMQLAPLAGEILEAAEEASPARPATSPTPEPGEKGKKMNVLLADDHPVLRQGLTRVLQEQTDIRVVGEAGDGREAVTLAKELHPDVVLMDVSLPLIDGVEATRRIVAECPGVCVIGLSMHDEQDMAATMRNAGAVDYVTKGGPIEVLIDAIHACHG